MIIEKDKCQFGIKIVTCNIDTRICQWLPILQIQSNIDKNKKNMDKLKITNTYDLR